MNKSQMRRMRATQNPAVHHYFDQRVPQRMKLLETTPEGAERVRRINEAEMALGHTRGAAPAILGPGFPDGEYAFQTSGTPGLEGDYVIVNVVDGRVQGGQNKNAFITLYVSGVDPNEVMIPRWDTPTIPYECYVPNRKGKVRRIPNKASAHALGGCDPREEEVDDAVLDLLAVARGSQSPMELAELSRTDVRVKGKPIPGLPITHSEAASSTRRLAHLRVIEEDRANWYRIPGRPLNKDGKFDRSNSEPRFRIPYRARRNPKSGDATKAHLAMVSRTVQEAIRAGDYKTAAYQVGVLAHDVARVAEDCDREREPLPSWYGQAEETVMVLQAKIDNMRRR